MSKLLLVALVTFGCIANVQAGDTAAVESGVHNPHQNHFLGKRPYSKAPQAKQQSPEDKWEGTGLITDNSEKGLDKHQQMRLNFIGKRPYAGSPAD